MKNTLKKAIAILSASAAVVSAVGCGNSAANGNEIIDESADTTEEIVLLNEVGTSDGISADNEDFSNVAEESYKNAADFFGTSKNLSEWGVSAEEIYGLYENAVSSDELIGHTIDLYDAVKDIDGNGDYEYLVASRFGFSDLKDSLIIFDNDSAGNAAIIYNSAEDTSLDWLDFQHITGHFYDCPINGTTGLDGTLYNPVYSSGGNFELGDDNTFYTAWWSNICVRNICYKIKYDGDKCELVKVSNSGWEAEIIYENEEPTDRCRITYTDFEG